MAKRKDPKTYGAQPPLLGSKYWAHQAPPDPSIREKKREELRRQRENRPRGSR